MSISSNLLYIISNGVESKSETAPVNYYFAALCQRLTVHTLSDQYIRSRVVLLKLQGFRLSVRPSVRHTLRPYQNGPDLGLDDNCQSPAAYCGNEINKYRCTLYMITKSSLRAAKKTLVFCDKILCRCKL